jgi:hypothetical protein
MFMRQGESFVATRPLAAASRKSIAFRGWALALARRIAVSCRFGLFAPPLPITLSLLAAPLTPVVGVSIALARLLAPPTPSRFLTGLTAIACLRAPRPEQPLATLEQTTPGPMMTTLWPRADVTNKMTSVHGRPCSRCSSLEAKR